MPEQRDVQARHVHVRGLVQGVGFRHYTKLEARELGLGGWVRNLDDGRVEVWFEGPATDVERLEAWLHRGPPGARVEGLDVRSATPEGHARFVVRLP
jgi:acylphosphatase